MSDDPNLSRLRRTLRLRWLLSIREFADIEEQRRTWLDPGQDHSHRSFIECMCSYFDDLALGKPPYVVWLREGVITPAEAHAVARFHAAADKYEPPLGDDFNHEAILSDPDWIAVVQAAGTALRHLEDLLTEPDELSVLRGGPSA